MANESRKRGKKLPKRAGKRSKQGYHSRYLARKRIRTKPPGWSKPKKEVIQRCDYCNEPTANKMDSRGRVLCNRAKRGLEYAPRTNKTHDESHSRDAGRGKTKPV